MSAAGRHVLPLLLACACAGPGASAQVRDGADPPNPGVSSTATLPPWLAFHGSQRTRYETIDHLYAPTQVGGDQQIAFRTRLQAGITTRPAWVLVELQDSRVEMTDSASRIDATMAFGTKVLQLHAGVRRRNVGGSGLDLQLEAGRFSRDFGLRRVIARNAYRNTTNAFDGVIARAGGPAWTVQYLHLRPVAYGYPDNAFDPRFRDARLQGLYATSTHRRSAHADAYLLRLDDGDRAPRATRRRLTTPGMRLSGTLGQSERFDYDVEVAAQWGDVGGLRHRAGLVHGQLNRGWTATWSPRFGAFYDHATGDRDPGDARSGAFDTLYGARRFELGPSGVYGLAARSNLRSPGVQMAIRPTAAAEFSVQYRGIWLDQARDRWRSSNLRDETGAAGTFAGRQSDVRLRYRWTEHLEFDGAVLFFEEARFTRTVKPSPSGHTTFVTLGAEVRF